MIKRKGKVPCKPLSKETNVAIYPEMKDNITLSAWSTVIATLFRATAYAAISNKNKTFFIQDKCFGHLAAH